MQRGARFSIFDVSSGGPCWAQRGRQKRYETSGLGLILQIICAQQKGYRRTTCSKNVCKITVFSHCHERSLASTLDGLFF